MSISLGMLSKSIQASPNSISSRNALTLATLDSLASSSLPFLLHQLGSTRSRLNFRLNNARNRFFRQPPER